MSNIEGGSALKTCSTTHFIKEIADYLINTRWLGLKNRKNEERKENARTPSKSVKEQNKNVVGVHFREVLCEKFVIIKWESA